MMVIQLFMLKLVTYSKPQSCAESRYFYSGFLFCVIMQHCVKNIQHYRRQNNSHYRKTW